MPSFSKLFKSRDPSSKKASRPAVDENPPAVKIPWSDAWLRTLVEPAEVSELLSGCTQELKSRALDMPFLLLPFRPTSNPSAARTFVRNYFFPPGNRAVPKGEQLMRELRLTEPMVLASVIKWCWSRLPGGVVTWEAYELFKAGETDSQFARDSFTTFIPMSVDSEARRRIVFDFFDLMAAIAAHGKTNGLSGRKFSRYAGWWAFEHSETGKGFDAGYKAWTRAANATSHLFFAYLRSMSPDPTRGTKGIIGLPISLQQLVQATEYPPQAPSLMLNEATKLVMIVDVVSPTPYALLRRAKNFEYRDDDHALQKFASQDDPLNILSDECRRVLRCISSTNQSTVSTSKVSTSLRDASWSRFEDIGFGATVEESEGSEEDGDGSMLGPVRRPDRLRSHARSANGDGARPTTPSWADFLSDGFPDEDGNKPSMLLPPDKVLPPISTSSRVQSAQSHRTKLDTESTLEPGELASIDKMDLDDSFWWVWITSLAGEEPTSRKAVFGRCALIETVIRGGKWMVMEEQVKGADPEFTPGAYVAEKKGFFGFTTRRGRLTRKKSSVKKMPTPAEPTKQTSSLYSASRTDAQSQQQARIQATAMEMQRRKHDDTPPVENARIDLQDERSNKTNSIMTLQPMVVSEASQAMKWAHQYDKREVRAQYLGDGLAGRGSSTDLLSALPEGDGASVPDDRQSSVPPPPPAKTPPSKLPSPPSSTVAMPPKEDTPPMTPSPLGQDSPPPQSPVLPPPNRDEPIPTPDSERETPSPGPTANSSIPRKAVASSPEQERPIKKKHPGATIKSIFGTRRKDHATRQAAATPAESNQAVAAARAALAGRDQSPKSLVGEKPGNLPISPAASGEESGTSFTPPTRPRMAPLSSHPTPPASNISPVSEDGRDEPNTDLPQDPPKSRHHKDDEQLSRVDTREREQADREFSTFDQGPLVEQPAFLPPDSPAVHEPMSATEYQDEPSHQFPSRELPSSPGISTQAGQAEPGAHHEEPGLNKPVSPITAPAQDRWAQIRKNAAERAARPSEEQSRPSEVRTDDGETSGEETIESRVARIKARVAELTGNIEASRP